MTDNTELLADLRSRINPAYENQRGTESYERKQCADAIEALEAQLKNASVAAIAEAAEVDRLQAEVDRLTTLAHGQHIELYNARLQLAAAQGQRSKIADRLEAAYDDSKPLMELMKEAQAIVESKQVFKKFVRGTPLENDIAIWMAEFAKEKLLAAPIPQQPSGPEGWKLVPIEPTGAMEVFIHRQAYKNALAAAPQPKDTK